MTQIPSIGRIVHVVPDADQAGLGHMAAVVTQVGTHEDPMDISVHIFVPGLPTLKFVTAVPYDESGSTPNTWHWPEYVPAKKDA